MIRIHASHHKCLTTYYLKVMNSLYNPTRLLRARFHHFESIEGQFYNNVLKYRLVSTNGFAVKPELLPEGHDYRISRFIRDPRDLIVSGYFYHLKGAEPWFRFKSPSFKYWEPINGNLPQAMPAGVSYTQYLNQLPKEAGLLAEMEFRKFHLESLRNWIAEDSKIRLFRYEDILFNEKKIFRELFRFYEFTRLERRLGTYLAGKFSLKKRKLLHHVRNPEPGQWKTHFTPDVTRVFNERYGDVLERYGY